VVFDRLAVFSGGFTLAAATAVVSGEGIEGWDVVDAVGGLLAKSMVVAEPDAGEHTRYQLLETLRQYGQERLDQDGHTDHWRRRHARHFTVFAAEVAGGLRGREEVAWRERLLGDLDKRSPNPGDGHRQVGRTGPRRTAGVDARVPPRRAGRRGRCHFLPGGP
jgi:predicted ATPase